MQYILSGSKQFRKNGGPHLKGSRRPRKKVARPLLLRRPKVVFFGAQADFFFFFFRRRLVMVFGGQITFSTPPQKNSAPPIFFRPPNFFFGGFFFFRRPKPKIGFSGGRLRSNIFRCQSGKTSAFFFFSAPPRHGVRRPNNFFDPQKIFFGGFFLCFRRSEKPLFFGAQNQKSAFSAGVEGAKALKLHSGFNHHTNEPLAVKIVLRGSNGFRVFRGTHLEGPLRLRMKGS